jgi:hypothetical protein
MTDAAHGAVPRPEHPRPDFQREHWLNLNGTWAFAFDPDDSGRTRGLPAGDLAHFDRHIVVPFAWQSALSGVEDADYAGAAWYRRAFSVPEAWAGRRIFLRFGAVDYYADVWVNGEHAGEHAGGYSPFEIDITALLATGDNVLVVRAEDPANLYEIPHGKQKSSPPDPWQQFHFTSSSGIWQTVWLEARPTAHITSIRLTPDAANERVTADIGFTSATRAMLTLAIAPPTGDTIEVMLSPAAGDSRVRADIPIPTPLLWDIDTPHLYEVTLALADGGTTDTVRTYFGMRQIEQRDGKVWMTALDQGYWPDGLYTAPTDDALRADIAYARQIGLNGLRKHLKVEDPRFNYWADKLGLLLWCDMPCPTLFNDTANARLRDELLAMVTRDYNHPSIVVWCPYNETWGLEFSLQGDTRMQAWMVQLYDELKAIDPTRLVVDNSGWSHVKSDLADFHYYTGNERDWRLKLEKYATSPDETGVFAFRLMADGYSYDGAPLMVSEFGFGWEHDSAWGLRWSTNALRRHEQIIGYTYCELYDVEYEYCGYTLYDRTPKDFGYDLRTINSDDYIVLDYTGAHSLFAGDSLTVPLYFSAYARQPATSPRVRWKLVRIRPEDEPEQVLLAGDFAFAPISYAVASIGHIDLTMPDTRGPVQLVVSVEDHAGVQRAVNTLDFEIYNPTQSFFQTAETGDTYYVTLGAPPGNKAKSFWNEGAHTLGSWVDDRPGAVWFSGAGSLTLRWPVISRNGFPAALSEMTVWLEIGSRPEAITQSVIGHDRPTEVTVTLNGHVLDTLYVPDLYVNARGALTRIHNTGVGEHGMLAAVSVPGDVLPHVVADARTRGYLELMLEVRADAKYPGGLTLFGARTGRYGIDPSIRIAVPKAQPQPAEEMSS